jgi:hypothetical protein
MAIPRFQTTKGKANFAALRSDLHNLGVTEESYFADHQRYSTSWIHSARDSHPVSCSR